MPTAHAQTSGMDRRDDRRDNRNDSRDAKPACKAPDGKATWNLIRTRRPSIERARRMR
jgi:hypothetical protein